MKKERVLHLLGILQPSYAGYAYVKVDDLGWSWKVFDRPYLLPALEISTTMFCLLWGPCYKSR